MVDSNHDSGKMPAEEHHMPLVIQASSAGYHGGNYAKITINERKVSTPLNSNIHSRGLHIVIMNPKTGETISAKVFDTYAHSEGFDKFITEEKFEEGSIVVAACKDECVTALTQDNRQWFADMGSKEIWDLQYRRAFAFIGIFGRRTCVEKRGILLHE